MPDIRLKTDFHDHHKTIKLKRRFGWEGVEALQRSWCFAANNRPKGIFTSMTVEDIAIAAGWQHDAQQFVDGLLELGWLDVTEDGETYSLHDWEEHQGFVFYSKERREIAIKAGKASALKRSLKANPQQGVEQSVEQGVQQKTRKRSTPSPSPSPLKKLCTQFWELYPSRNGKKVGKGETGKRFMQLSEEEQEKAIVAVTNYAASNPYPVDPIRFFKSREYPDGLWREWISPDIQTLPAHGDNGNVKTEGTENMLDRIKKLEKETSHE